jgi:PAS domain S-box-containing protein
VRGLEAVAERPDGTRVPFAPFPTPLFRPNGELAGAVNMLMDLSDRKASEHERNLLAAIVASSNDAIVSKSLEGIVSSWNVGAQKIFGYTADEMIGQSIMRLIPEDRADEERMILERLQKGERIEHYETIRRRKDGAHLHVSLTISPLKDGSGRIVGASKIARDITERKNAEERMMLLAREVDHRANNMLAVVQAVLELTQADTMDGLKAAMRGRIEALGHAHKLLSGSSWEGADLRRLIEDELRPYDSAGQIRLTGDAHLLKPDVAQSVALLIHELATNAAKYGSLSSPGGSLAIDWTRDGNAIALRWTERGGPPVNAPSRHGFGTRVMQRMVRGQPDSAIHFDWQPDGLVCEVRLPG